MFEEANTFMLKVTESRGIASFCSFVAFKRFKNAANEHQTLSFDSVEPLSTRFKHLSDTFVQSAADGSCRLDKCIWTDLTRH